MVGEGIPSVPKGALRAGVRGRGGLSCLTVQIVIATPSQYFGRDLTITLVVVGAFVVIVAV